MVSCPSWQERSVSSTEDEKPRQWDVLSVIAVGSIIGAEARYGMSKAFPHSGGQIPWSTVLINVIGCLLIGVLMVVVVELIKPHRLARPFLGIGIVGGFTTFSTFAVDAERLIDDHRPGMALVYVLTTLALGAVALAASTALTRAVSRRFVT
jgi:CrcB protein